MSVIDYSSYTNYVESVCKANDLTQFKSHPNFTWVLEHVSQHDGFRYLSEIIEKTRISLQEIRAFCEINDAVGSPTTMRIGIDEMFRVSPTSLRYIFHAHLILTHIQSLQLPTLDIVEVGGGYGGLCIALHHFAKKYNVTINSYTILDLSSISTLQKLYLTKVAPSLSVDTQDGSTFGASITNSNTFLISNYCFSEISSEFQKKYRETLFPKVSHGFMVWNMIPTYDLGFSVREENEYPRTGGNNKYLYF